MSWSPKTLPSSNIMNSLHKPALDTCRSSCQQKNSALHVLLERSWTSPLRGGWSTCVSLTWLGICLAVYWMDGQLHGPLTWGLDLPQWLHWAGEQGSDASGRWSGASRGCLLSQKYFLRSCRCLMMGNARNCAGHSASSFLDYLAGWFEGLQALPPLLQGPVGQAMGCLQWDRPPPPTPPQHASPPPQLSWPVPRILPK